MPVQQLGQGMPAVGHPLGPAPVPALHMQHGPYQPPVSTAHFDAQFKNMRVDIMVRVKELVRNEVNGALKRAFGTGAFGTVVEVEGDENRRKFRRVDWGSPRPSGDGGGWQYHDGGGSSSSIESSQSSHVAPSQGWGWQGKWHHWQGWNDDSRDDSRDSRWTGAQDKGELQNSEPRDHPSDDVHW